MRIAIVGKKHPFCGIVTYCRELVRTLRQAGHTVAFYYLHNEEVHEENEDSLPLLLRTHMYAVPYTDAPYLLTERLRQFRPDVVHASYALSFLDFALPAICEELGVPLVVTFHPAFDSRPTIPNRISGAVYRMYAPTLARATRVIVFSRPQKERLVHLKVPEELVNVLPNGVDVARYTPGSSRFKQAIGADVLVSYMGRIDPEKNVGTLLNVFEQLALPDNVHLAVMGDGILAQRLRQRYEHLPTLHWLGFVSDERERIDVLRGSDLFVLPSSVEGLSLALLEAMACGAAPIATDVGADGEVIAGCGRVLDPTRLRRQLPRALRDLLADPAEVTRIRRAARQRVERRFDFRKNLALLLAIYDEACTQRPLVVH